MGPLAVSPPVALFKRKKKMRRARGLIIHFVSGYGGHCYNQTCESGSWQATVAAWYRQNLQIAIPVTIIAGLIILAILFFIARCIYRSCCGRRGARAGGAARNTKYVPANGDAYYGPPPTQSGGGAMPMSAVAAPQPALQRGYESRASVEPLMAGSGSGVGAGYGRPNTDYDHDHRQVYPPGQRYSQGYGDTFEGQGYEYNQAPQYSSFAPGTGGGGGGGGVYGQTGGWVDDRTWNGQYYGRQEAYGR